MTIMKTVTAVSMTLTLVGAALAQDSGARSINTGGEKGAYHTLFCPPLPAALSNAYFQGYTCTPSKGTLENIDRVLRYPTSVGFVQLDVAPTNDSQGPTNAFLHEVAFVCCCFFDQWKTCDELFVGRLFVVNS